ncbi:MAG: cytochrome [Hyphomicrobiales bacterium]|nr:cytochrome [Hyphomicrobiales bacterium]
MRKIATGVLMVAFMSLAASALAADKPDWAFPVTDKTPPATLPDDGKAKAAPGSDRAYTRAQIEDLFNPPDWYPAIHPAMPNVVAHGEPPNVRACAACHLPTGTGHTESASVAGMPAAYLLQQMDDYRTGARKGSGSMLAIAKAISDEGNKQAAAYFASLKPRAWIRVVEAETVPKTYVAAGNKRVIHPDHMFEPLGARIIELAEDENRLLNRDPGSGFVAFVPKGAVEKGRALAQAGGPQACASCHGENNRGTKDMPGLAGRTPTYLVRQLFMIQSGERAGVGVEAMKAIVAKLSTDDMLNLSAYFGSLEP